MRSVAFGIVVISFAVTFISQSWAESAAWHVTDLRCEYSTDPLGIDVPRPRLFWQLAGTCRGQRQTAYQILVASTSDRLDENEGDLWDSGRVKSNASTFIDYDGKRLKSSQQVFWKVRSWDERGEPSPWSHKASWTMGVVANDHWQAQWIVAPWQTESVLMRRGFEAKPGFKRATIHICGLGQFELFLKL